MKKSIKLYLTISFLSSALILSCHSGTDKTADETTPMKNDSIVATDSTRVVNDSGTKTSMIKPNPALKGKKGKVSTVMMANSKGNSANMNMDSEGYYNNVETSAVYTGGQNALDKFINDNIEYPSDANNNGIEGTVNVNFGIDEKGKVYNPQVVSDKIGYGLEDEALKVINKMPMWTSGSIKGKKVKSRYTLAIHFQLE